MDRSRYYHGMDGNIFEDAAKHISQTNQIANPSSQKTNDFIENAIAPYKPGIAKMAKGIGKQINFGFKLSFISIGISSAILLVNLIMLIVIIRQGRR